MPTKKVEFSESLWRFENEIENVVFGKAFSKGYAGRELDKFMESNFPHHALGEIVYKAIRYKAKRDPEDLVKIAAWSLLLFDRIQRNENKQESPNKDRNEIS